MIIVAAATLLPVLASGATPGAQLHLGPTPENDLPAPPDASAPGTAPPAPRRACEHPLPAGSLEAQLCEALVGATRSGPIVAWTSLNDGPGSGLDADTVDGVSSEAFFDAIWNESRLREIAVAMLLQLIEEERGQREENDTRVVERVDSLEDLTDRIPELADAIVAEAERRLLEDERIRNALLDEARLRGVDLMRLTLESRSGDSRLDAGLGSETNERKSAYEALQRAIAEEAMKRDANVSALRPRLSAIEAHVGGGAFVGASARIGPMTITDGNVGIGVAAPDRRLEVRGDVAFGTGAQMLGAEAGRLEVTNLAPDGDFRLRLSPGGILTDLFIVKGDNGHVGLGTATPGDRLTVRGGGLRVESPRSHWSFPGEKVYSEGYPNEGIFGGVEAVEELRGLEVTVSVEGYTEDAGTLSLAWGSENSFLDWIAFRMPLAQSWERYYATTTVPNEATRIMLYYTDGPGAIHLRNGMMTPGNAREPWSPGPAARFFEGDEERVAARYDASADRLLIDVHGANALAVSPGGNVGLGTAAPSDKLTVRNGNIRIEAPRSYWSFAGEKIYADGYPNDHFFGEFEDLASIRGQPVTLSLEAYGEGAGTLSLAWAGDTFLDWILYRQPLADRWTRHHATVTVPADATRIWLYYTDGPGAIHLRNGMLTLGSGREAWSTGHLARYVEGDEERVGARYDARSDRFLLDVHGSSRLAIDSMGNVGLGTLRPDSRLHLAGPHAGITIHDDSAAADGNSAYILFQSNRATAGTTHTAAIRGILADATAAAPKGALAFETVPSGGGGPMERLRIDHAGNVGVGTTTPAARLHVAAGDLRVDGHIHAHTDSHVGDIAEPVVGEGLEPGDVVVMDGFTKEGKPRVRKADAAYSRDVIGVVSTNPSLRLAGLATDTPLAVTGIVPVKVVGPVARGDLLTTSDVPGHAMACKRDGGCGGAVVGKAMEDGSGAGTAAVRAMISLG